jgi:hypothetical protein
MTPLTDDAFPIQPGDWLLCQNGHRAFKAVTTIDSGSRILPADFVDEAGAAPKLGAEVVCPKCGAAVVINIDGRTRPWSIERAKA